MHDTKEERNTQTNKFERVKEKGNEAIDKIKEMVKEGNVRNVIVKDKNDKVIASFPLTLGVAGAVIAPVVAALGAILALATDCSIYVEKR